MLSLVFGSDTFVFPQVWLRENCRCSICFFENGHQRLLDPDDDAIGNAEISDYRIDNATLYIEWLDGHKSEFRVDWLAENGRFTHGDKPDDFDFHIPWAVTDLPNIPSFDYQEIMDGHSKEYLRAVSQYGVFLVTGAPTAEETVTDFANSISFSGIRSTNFGAIFDLRVHDHKNMKLAFTNKRISLHNDLLIRRQPPTVTLLHCLQKSGSGGESLISDGLAVALYMKENFPDAYDILTTTEVEVEDINANWHYISRRSVIAVESGVVKSIQFNNWERSPNIRIDPKRYGDFRAAYRTFSVLAHSDQFCHRHPLGPGEIIVVDNSRLLHGRGAFEQGGGGGRHLQGCHIDIDDLTSAFRKSKSVGILQ